MFLGKKKKQPKLFSLCRTFSENTILGKFIVIPITG